jgi:hypothetical protein
VLDDLEHDQAEQHNLVGEPTLQATADELAATFKRRMVTAGEAAPPTEPAPGRPSPAV